MFSLEVVSAAVCSGLIVVVLLVPEGYIPLGSRNLRKAMVRLGREPPTAQKRRLGFILQLLLKLPVRALVRVLARLVPDGYRRRSEHRLMLARLHEELPFELFLHVKVAAALLFSIYFVFLALGSGDPLYWWLSLAVAILGTFVPDQWLNMRINQRRRAVLRELPATLSTLAITTEAGLILGGAIAEVGRNRSGVLAEELRWATDQMSLGLPQATALETMATRCEVSELTLVVSSLIQSFEKGSHQVVAALRTQAADAWLNRRRKAEELAQQASIKLFLPLILMVFPAIMIFLLGPAALTILQFFSGPKP